MVLKLDDYKDFEMFYKLPQELFDDCFKGLSLGAKVLYAILRDKWGQSQKNGWHDENGIYCNFSVKLLSEIMGCSEKTIISYKKELSNYHLISERRQFNSTNKIYVNRVSEAKSHVHEDFTCTEVKNLHHVHEDFTCTEVKNLQSNQTNINQTNLTRPCYPEGAGGNSLYSIEDAPPQNDLGIVHDWIFSEFGRYPTPFEIEDLKYFLQDHSKEVIKLAIKECVGNGKPYFKYLESILRDWKQKGLTTVELVENRQRPKRSSGKSSSELRLSDDGYNPRLGF